MDTTRYSAPALEKGLDIIELLADHPEGLSLVELGRALGRTTNEIFRMVHVLLERGYLQREPGTDGPGRQHPVLAVG